MPVRDKTGASVTKAFEKVMINRKRKPEWLWVDKGREFYIRELKKLLEKNGILMYHTFNEGKAVVVERFNRTLKKYNVEAFNRQQYKYISGCSSFNPRKIQQYILQSYQNDPQRSKSKDKRRTDLFQFIRR